PTVAEGVRTILQRRRHGTVANEDTFIILLPHGAPPINPIKKLLAPIFAKLPRLCALDFENPFVNNTTNFDRDPTVFLVLLNGIFDLCTQLTQDFPYNRL